MNNCFRKYNNKLIKVIFADPSDYDSRFDTKFLPVKCCAVGWLVNETKDCLRLVWLLDEIDGPSAGLAIPSGSVISIQHIFDGREEEEFREKFGNAVQKITTVKPTTKKIIDNLDNELEEDVYGQPAERR